MNRKLLVGIIAAITAQGGRAFSQELSPEENSEINSRIQRFYSRDPEVLNEHIPKYSIGAHAFKTKPSPLTELDQVIVDRNVNPLARNAGRKRSKVFRDATCANLGNHFIKSPCGHPSDDSNLLESTEGEKESDYTDLTQSWIPKKNLVKYLDDIPTTASVENHPWADDYWRLAWGGVSYRLSSGKEFATYKEALADYSQPESFDQSSSRSSNEFSKIIASWSPAEKYDLAIGDTDFGLTLEQRAEGAKEADEQGNVPNWVGICDGWSSAGIMTPRPVKPVDVVGVNNVNIHMTPSDVRALTSLAWARGSYETNTVGTRCDVESPELYANGRIKDTSCFDTNPATFHLTLGNMIGIGKKSFVIDTSFDAEIWNQPMVSYEFTYFNPLDPSKRDKDWHNVAVDYNDEFKSKDRFQEPLTRGIHKRRSKKWDDSEIQKIVGVIATITYMDEAIPSADDKPPEEYDTRVTYVYDLELSAGYRGKLTPTGGEWQNNTHPDFLWVPKKGTVAEAKGDVSIDYSTKETPNSSLTKAARKLSKKGSPLCNVVSEIVNSSAKQDTYPKCANERRSQ